MQRFHTDCGQKQDLGGGMQGNLGKTRSCLEIRREEKKKKVDIGGPVTEARISHQG
jgi:hypothetical protein